MKTSFADLFGCRRQNGSTVLVLITLLAIMVILATADSKALFQLHRETKLLEKQQIERLNASQTNTLSLTLSPAQPGSK